MSRRPPRRLRFAVWGLSTLAIAGAVGALLTVVTRERADTGALEEPRHTRPASVPPVELSVATATWALDEIDLGGGGALTDLDGDGDLDLVVANGAAMASLWNGVSFGPPIDLGVDDAVSATNADVDSDGWGRRHRRDRRWLVHVGGARPHLRGIACAAGDRRHRRSTRDRHRLPTGPPGASTRGDRRERSGRRKLPLLNTRPLRRDRSRLLDFGSGGP